MFVSHAANASKREWRFVSPDYSSEIVWKNREVKKQFPGLKCEDGDTDVFIVYNIPKEMNGWYAVCLFTDSKDGMLASDGAKITVKDAEGKTWTAPAATPEPTPEPSRTPEVIEVVIAGDTPEQTETPEISAAPAG